MLKKFKTYRNKLNADIRKAKKIYYECLFAKIYNDPRKLWYEVNHLGQFTDSKMRTNIKAISQDMSEEAAINAMNEYFAHSGDYVPPSGHRTQERITRRTRQPNTISLCPVTPSEVHSSIIKLRDNVATGADELGAVPLKHVADLILEPLAHIINCIIVSGIFPSELKLARVCPVQKGGALNNLSNYRPISVLPVLSKVFESAINCRLRNFLTKYQIINSAQYGFQKGKSTELALLNVKEEILNNFEKKKLYTVGLFLDLRKAFDSIKHDILEGKLYDYGLRGAALKLIMNYLSDRKKYVKIGSLASAETELKQGVPQGSILGPLLFILYINDICSIPYTEKLVMYADDTNAFFSAETMVDLQVTVTNYLRHLEFWLHENKLALNASKTKYVIFRPTNKPCITLKFSFQDTTLECVKTQKFLGVWFEENMSWNTHVTKLAPELGKTVGCMYKLSDLVPLWLKKGIYYVHFYSRLSYCALVWANTSAQNLNKLQVLQKKVLRISENFYGLPSELRTRQLFLNHDFARASDLYTYKLILYTQKNKLHQHSVDSSRRYPLRNQSNPVPLSRTRYGKCLLKYQIPTMLNKFSTSIHFELPARKFKKHVRSQLLNI